MNRFLKNCAVLGGLLSLGGFLLLFAGLALGGSTRYLSFGPWGWGQSSTYVDLVEENAPIAYAAELPPDEAWDEVVIQQGTGEAYAGHHGHAEATFTEELDFENIELELGLAEVYIEPGDCFSLAVDGSGPAYQSYSDGDTLHIVASQQGHHSGGALTGADHQIFYLTLPYDAELQEVELTIGAGSLNVTGLFCQELEVEAGMGEIVLDQVICTDEAELTASMGSITATDFTCDGDVKLTADMGNIDLAGRITGHADIDCGMGYVGLILDHPGSYGYEVDCGMGSVRLGDQSFSGSSKSSGGSADGRAYFDIECGMGCVEISFED